MNPTPKDSLPPIPASVVRTLLVRLAMLLVLAGSVWLAWWSVDRYLLMQRLQREKDSELAGLVDEVQQLELKWDAGEAERVEARFKEAGELLFAGPEERDGWQKEMQREGLLQAFATTVRLGPAQPHPATEHKLSTFRATLDLQAAPAARSAKSPYARLLGFAGTLEKGERRVDWLELSVLGNSNSVRQASAVLQLWSQEGKP